MGKSGSKRKHENDHRYDSNREADRIANRNIGTSTTGQHLGSGTTIQNQRGQVSGTSDLPSQPFTNPLTPGTQGGGQLSQGGFITRADDNMK